MFNYYPKEKVYSFQKSLQEELQFAVSDRKGKTFVDIRAYHIQEDGSKIGTHKGIFIPAEKLTEFKAGVDQLIEAVGGLGHSVARTEAVPAAPKSRDKQKEEK